MLLTHPAHLVTQAARQAGVPAITQDAQGRTSEVDVIAFSERAVGQESKGAEVMRFNRRTGRSI